MGQGSGLVKNEKLRDNEKEKMGLRGIAHW
jgi:hypothetical protein